MKIFIIAETLTTGGAEWFSLRLAKALTDHGHDVSFFVMRPDMINDRIARKFAEIELITLPLAWTRLLVQGDRVWNKIFGKKWLVEAGNARLIRNYYRRKGADAIHSHLIEADLVALSSNLGEQVQLVTTVHGDYTSALKQNKRQREIRKLMHGLSHIAVISEEQRSILSDSFPDVADKISKIYNGYPPPETARHTIGKTHSVFVFGMIARAIPEKGWKPLIRAFSRISDKNVRLVLYGEGAYLDNLKSENDDERIEFAGFSDDPLAAIGKMDVGLLPSYLKAESLPTTVIEYLAMKKPVIVTNVGEMKNMIKDDRNESAGIVIDELDETAMVPLLYEAMMKLSGDKQFYEEKALCAERAFEKFSMNKCVQAYEKLYRIRRDH
ncbi:MAG TPA: glycosyltransferase family 4 protein [Flavipsychrobacter sp.]|nr:glycosyltransferase family 4 protein [Flavipsychrobacter sp.]